jgi:putative AlgH/UPF0301 family transcriptional regulator
MSTKKTIETPEQIAQRQVVEGIANNIRSLSRAVYALLGGPLKKKALVVLLSSSAQMPQTQVERVLKALEDLEGDWLNK